MLALVWLIDILVIFVKILGGRMDVNPVVRFAAWLAFLSLLGAAIALIGVLLVLLDHWLHTLQ